MKDEGKVGYEEVRVSKMNRAGRAVQDTVRNIKPAHGTFPLSAHPQKGPDGKIYIGSQGKGGFPALI
jgi:hypothetical protein